MLRIKRPDIPSVSVKAATIWASPLIVYNSEHISQPSPSPTIMSKLDAILQRYVAQGDDTTDTLLGATFTVLNRAGETIYTGSAGRTDFPVDSSPYNPQTVTWIASMTKLLTATSLLQLVSANKITLDEDLRPRLPRLAQLQILTGFDGDKPLLQDNTHPITLRQLLTHTSGLIYDLAEPEVMKWSASANRASNCLTWDIDGFAAPLVYPPGQGWRYGTSTDWAGILLEHITGQTLGEYMREHIFTPLEMADTTFRPHTRPDLLARRAAMTFRPTTEGGGEPLVPIPYPTPERHEVESGGSGLYSTLADYTKFLAAIVSGDERILDRETRELLFAPQLTGVQRESMRTAVEEAQDVYAIEFPAGLGIDFGFGGMVNTEDLPGRRRKGSVMWSGMANGHWWIDRESGIAGVFSTTVMRQPPGDPVVKKVFIELEEAVYAEFGGNRGASAARRVRVK